MWLLLVILCICIMALSAHATLIKFEKTLPELFDSVVTTSIETNTGFAVAGYFTRNTTDKYGWIAELDSNGNPVFLYMNSWQSWINAIAHTENGIILAGAVKTDTGHDIMLTHIIAGRHNWTRQFHTNGISAEVVSILPSFVMDGKNDYILAITDERGTEKNATFFRVNQTGDASWWAGPVSNYYKNYTGKVAYTLTVSPDAIFGLGHVYSNEGDFLWLFSVDYDGYLYWTYVYQEIEVVEDRPGALEYIDEALLAAVNEKVKNSNFINVHLFKMNILGRVRWNITLSCEENNVVGSIIPTKNGIFLAGTSYSYNLIKRPWFAETDSKGNLIKSIKLSISNDGELLTGTNKDNLYIASGSMRKENTSYNTAYIVAIYVDDCGPGFYRDYNGSCQFCKPGYYQPENDTTNCLACPSGTYNPSTGGISISNCLLCPEGTANEEEGMSECYPVYIPPSTKSTIYILVIILGGTIIIICALYVIKCFTETADSKSKIVSNIIWFVWLAIDIVLGLTDATSDILYLITGDFYNRTIYALCIVFVVLPPYLYLGYTINAIVKKHKATTKVTQGACDELTTIFFPFYSLCSLAAAIEDITLVFFIIASPLLGELKLLLFLEKRFGYTMVELTIHMQVIESLFESIPQLILQVVNSQLLHTWSFISVISVFASIISIVYTFTKVMLQYTQQSSDNKPARTAMYVDKNKEDPVMVTESPIVSATAVIKTLEKKEPEKEAKNGENTDKK